MRYMNNGHAMVYFLGSVFSNIHLWSVNQSLPEQQPKKNPFT